MFSCREQSNFQWTSPFREIDSHFRHAGRVRRCSRTYIKAYPAPRPCCERRYVCLFTKTFVCREGNASSHALVKPFKYHLQGVRFPAKEDFGDAAFEPITGCGMVLLRVSEYCATLFPLVIYRPSKSTRVMFESWISTTYLPGELSWTWKEFNHASQSRSCGCVSTTSDSTSSSIGFNWSTTKVIPWKA